MVSPASSTLYQFATLCKPKNPNLFVNIAKSVRVAHMSHQNPSIRTKSEFMAALRMVCSGISDVALASVHSLRTPI